MTEPPITPTPTQPSLRCDSPPVPFTVILAPPLGSCTALASTPTNKQNGNNIHGHPRCKQSYQKDNWNQLATVFQLHRSPPLFLPSRVTAPPIESLFTVLIKPRNKQSKKLTTDTPCVLIATTQACFSDRAARRRPVHSIARTLYEQVQLHVTISQLTYKVDQTIICISLFLTSMVLSTKIV